MPDHAPESIKSLTSSCIAYNAHDRPKAERLFRDALENVDERDRASATRRILYTTSESRPQYQTWQISGETESAETQVGRSGAIPHQEVKRDLTASSVSLPTDSRHLTAGNTVQGPPFSIAGSQDTVHVPRQSVDSFYSTQNGHNFSNYTQLPTAPIKLSSSRPKSLLDSSAQSFQDFPVPGQRLEGSSTSTLSSPVPTLNESEHRMIGEVTELIGSLVLDFERHPPRNMLKPESPYKFRQYDLGTNLMFQSQNTTYRAAPRPPKRSIFGFLKKDYPHPPLASFNPKVSIKADRCMEYVLENSEEIFQAWGSWPNPRSYTWFSLNKHQMQRVYIVVSYIVYLNARVQEADASTPYPEKQYEKKGWQIQAVTVREIQTQQSYDVASPEVYTLGHEMSAYFWGPRNRPY